MVKVGFVALRCADLERSRRFYELVGLAFSEEQHGSGPRHLSSDLDGIVLELYPASASGPRVDLVTVGLTLPDVDGLVAALIAAGFNAEHADGAPTVVATDPDGRRVRISTAR